MVLFYITLTNIINQFPKRNINNYKMKKNTVYSEIWDILMVKYPKSGPTTVQMELDWKNDEKFLLSRIIALHDFAKKEEDVELMEWVYHFARRIYFDYDHQKEVPGIIEYSDAFEKIQIEGVNYYLDSAITEQQRLESGQLYKTEYGIIMAGNIPRVGSSSICSNCSEPISFAQTVCYCCKYPTIGPHGYPRISIPDWKDLKPKLKISYHASAFEKMDNDIRNHGLKRAWNDPSKDMMPLYVAMGIYPSKMFGGDS